MILDNPQKKAWIDDIIVGERVKDVVQDGTKLILLFESGNVIEVRPRLSAVDPNKGLRPQLHLYAHKPGAQAPFSEILE